MEPIPPADQPDTGQLWPMPQTEYSEWFLSHAAKGLAVDGTSTTQTRNKLAFRRFTS